VYLGVYFRDPPPPNWPEVSDPPSEFGRCVVDAVVDASADVQDKQKLENAEQSDARQLD
jgi:hypothetical protein